MMQRSTATPPVRSLFLNFRYASGAGFAVAAMMAASLGVHAQTPAATTGEAAPAQVSQPAATHAAKPAKVRAEKPGKNENKMVASKDTKKEDKKVKKDSQLQGMDPNLPDKQLYDKAEDSIKHGHFDVGRLDLQTLLNTYPESKYMMRSKLAIADSWYKEGGMAALTQAEQEYKDFITFFPNAPEAAEAQMRVGDIFFKQMDKPDRDNTYTVKAEQAYRLMLQQFPDSPLRPQAEQRLREVQEVLAAREASIATFYATKQPPDLAGAIARYQTVVDTYPLYSHVDETLIALGDLYEGEAKAVLNGLRPRPDATPAQKAQLESARTRLAGIYHEQAVSCLSKVVLEHSAAPHAEDARDRLAGMGLPIPTPTPEQVAASTALENSRGQYTLSKRAVAIFLRQADTVPAATIGNPPLEDAKATLAPAVVKRSTEDYIAAINNTAPPAPAANAPATAAAEAPAAPAPAPASTAPLSFQDVPTGNAPASSSPVVTSMPSASPSGGVGANSIGAEIVQPSGTSEAPSTPSGTPPAFPGTATQSTATSPVAASPDANGGLKPVGPANATPLPPIEKPAAAADVINDAAGQKLPAAQAPPENGKKPKPALDKADDSSSKHKKKKGLSKLNPF